MKIIEKKLKNGSNLILVPIKDALTVTVLVLVSAGSKYENKDKNGISHFLEHMCFKGTVKRPKALDISLELDKIGSQYNAFTSEEFTGYYAKANPKHIDTLIDVISDIYLNPSFNKEEMEKEKGVIIEEINMYEDMPHRQVQDIFTNLLYGDTPAGRSVLGTKENIMNMTTEDLSDYRKKHYIAEKTNIVVSGSFDSKEIKKKIEKAFSSIKKSKKIKKEKVVEKQNKPSLLVKEKTTDQTHLVLGVRTFDANDKRNSTLKVLDCILGGGMSSRLFHRLREEMGVGYYVRTSIDEFTDHGNFSVSIGCDSKRTQEVVSAILNEFERIKRGDIDEEEISKAKEYFIGNTFLSLESSDSFAEYVGFQSIVNNKIEKPSDLVVKIKKVTKDDIRKLANQIFTNDRLNLAIIGNIENKDEISKILTF